MTDANKLSRKARVHALFVKEGPEAAWTLGLKLRLTQGTLRAWFSAWRNANKTAKPKSKTNSAKAKPAKTVAAPEPQPAPVA